MEFTDLQGKYDLIIAGTGLSESLISGCCAQAGKKLINFDKNTEYGGSLRTKGINDFISWATENGEVITNNVRQKLGEKVRNGAYCFDLFPIIVFSRDKLIDVLVRSKGFESLTTYLVDGLFFRTKDSFRLIPSSKSSIFSDKKLSLRQKRAVMKFVSFFLPESEYGHTSDTDEIAQKVEEFKDKPFNSFLKSLSFDDDLSGAFEYFVASANKGPLLTSEAVPRIREFLKSFGRWGPTPFVQFSYGSAETPQLFARHSAVYGGLYVLDHFPQTVKNVTEIPTENNDKNEDNSTENNTENNNENEDVLVLNVAEIGEIKTKIYITTPMHLESTGEKRLLAHREVLLLNKKMLAENNSFCVIAPNVFGNEKPVYIYQFDSVFNCCQKGEYVVHFSSMCEIRHIVDLLVDEITPKEEEVNKGDTTSQKPNEEKPNEEKPNEEKPNEEKPNEEKPNEEKPNEEKPNEEKPNEEKPNEEKPNEEKQIGEEKIEVIDHSPVILRAAFVLEEDVVKEPLPKGVYVIKAPSVEELAMGTNYFVDIAEDICQKLFPGIPFFPEPTEVEIEVDESQLQKENEEKPSDQPEGETKVEVEGEAKGEVEGAADGEAKKE